MFPGMKCYEINSKVLVLQHKVSWRRTMLLTKLLHALHAFSPRYDHAALAGVEVFAQQPLAAGPVGAGGVLYPGTLTEARALLKRQPALAGLPLLCIDDGQSLPEELSKLVLVAEGTKTEDLTRAVVEALARDAGLQAGMQRLIGALNSNRGLQYLVDEAYKVLHNPISVIDISYRILALTAEGFEDRPDIEEQRRSGYLMPENLADLREDGVYRKLRETRYPHRSKQKRFDMPWLHTLVFIQGIEVASISLMEKGRPITKDDIELFHFLSELVSLELQKSDFFKANRGFMHSFLLSELLEGRIVDTGVIDMRLQQLDWRPTRNMYVLVLAGRAGPLPGEQLDLIAKQLHGLLPDSRWAIYERTLVFLLSMPGEEEDFLAGGGQLSGYLASSGLVAMVSDRFSNLLDTRRQYQKALKAGEIGGRMRGGENLYYYPDYRIYYMGSILEANGELADFIHPSVARIAQHDRDHGTRYLDTLTAHLQWPDNPTKAAESLFVHRNTLFYRLSRLREAFAVNLSDGDERLQIQLSLKFLHLIDG